MTESARTAPPSQVAELALACVDYVRRAVGAELDYTPDTLPILDEYLRKARGTAQAEIVRLVAPAVGAYFGEVLRRSFDCRWHAPGSEFSSWRVEFARCFLYFNPIGMAVEAIQLEDTAGLGATIVTSDDALADLRAQLERAAPVRVEDYYALTTRFEVIDQIVHFLMVRSRELGTGREYDADFYRAQAKDEPPAQA
ncbi:MAG: hypothetical protein HYY06_08800 [Deltaproteobacteria bacterium]|nr:hypothetical protein [Deltaproteobacteria bacterium]